MDRRGWIAGTVGALCVLALCCVTCFAGGFLLVGGRYMPCVPGRPVGIAMHDLVGRYLTAGGGELTLDASGGFTSQGITIEFDNRPLSLAGPGRWSLLSPDDAGVDIHLDFAQTRFSTYLEISGTRAEPWLYWYIGDPDVCHIQRFDRP